MDTNSRLAKMLDQEEAYKTKKHCCLRPCPIIEYFGISVAFCYYSLLGRVMGFLSRVRVVKKIYYSTEPKNTRYSKIFNYWTQITMFFWFYKLLLDQAVVFIFHFL